MEKTTQSAAVSASPESNRPDDDAVNRAKQEIQALFQEVVDLSKSDIERNEFFAALLEKSIAALAAIGGVVWMIEEGTGLKLQYQVNLQQSGLAENPAAQMQHARLLGKIAEKGQPALVAPHSGPGGEPDDEQIAANPTDCLLVVAPIQTDQGVDGLVEIFQRTGARATTQRGYLRFLTQICEPAGEYLKTQRLKQFVTKQSLWEQLESFTTLVHQKLDSRQTAYTIANEGRRLIGCDRVTVVLRKGGKYVVEAISGQDTFDKRSNVVRMLRNLARVVGRSEEDLWYSGETDDLAPQVERAVNDYVDESQTKQMAVLPIREADDEEEQPGKPKRRRKANILGVIIIEQLVDGQTPEGMMQRVDVVRRHSSTALTNAQFHESLFLLPLWRLLGKSRALVTARNLPKTIGALLLIGGAIAAMCLVPCDFNVIADGKLMPSVRRYVFARQDGLVVDVPVDHGQWVEQGQVVAEQESLPLQQQIVKIIGEINEANEQFDTLRSHRSQRGRRQTDDDDRTHVEADMTRLEQQIKSLHQQKQLLESQRQDLEVRSPIDGKIVTWRVKELLRNHPVTRSQRLMEVADPTQAWELEVFVPEKRMGHVVRRLQELREEDPNATLQVTFMLRSNTSTKLHGQVREIEPGADVHGEDGNTVRMFVQFDQAQLKQLVDDPASDLTVGADVRAKIYCGEKPIGYVWFHDLWEFVQSRVLFRL